MIDTNKIMELFNCAMSFKNIGNYVQAAKLYEQILEITTQLPEVYFNLAFVYQNLDNWEKETECLEKFVALEPKDIEGRYFLSIAYFKQKQYEKGFELFENRISRSHAIITQEKLYQKRFTNIPFWRGENLEGKTIFVYYEAGLGDTLMYFRYLPLLKNICKKVYFKPQIALNSLFAENRGDVKIISFFKEEMAVECDYQCPIMSLPYYLGLNNKTIFTNSDKFLNASLKKEKFYKKQFFDNDKLKIGIKWQGNTFIGEERAMSAESFARIFDIFNSKVYSVQVMGGYDEIEKLKSKFDITDLGSTFKDFSDTAGAIANLDIVICNDTSVGHLAGAMGKKTYIILPKNYDWRWHWDISKCDWYDNVKLFRQKTTWEEVIERIYSDINVN